MTLFYSIGMVYECPNTKKCGNSFGVPSGRFLGEGKEGKKGKEMKWEREEERKEGR